MTDPGPLVLIVRVETGLPFLQGHTESAPQFALAPACWYYIGSIEELADGPVSLKLAGERSFVGYRTKSGRIAVISGRCAHMGADLSKGCVVGERISCPLHGWEYGPDGQCEHIPASPDIPPFAWQASFPVTECGGHVFFFNRKEALFPFPFFDGVQPDQLLAASPFDFIAEAPWYLATANAFDVQHFRYAHNRTLESEPYIDSPGPFCRRLQATFSISGTSVYDRITHFVSGARVKMTVTSWAGNLVFVKAEFRRTTTYGLVSFIPTDKNRTWVRDIVWIRRSQSVFAQQLLDPLTAIIRRLFIKEFIRADVDPVNGIHLITSRLIEADKPMADYFKWLQSIAD